jgi:hypothetical protein
MMLTAQVGRPLCKDEFSDQKIGNTKVCTARSNASCHAAMQYDRNGVAKHFIVRGLRYVRMTSESRWRSGLSNVC